MVEVARQVSDPKGCLALGNRECGDPSRVGGAQRTILIVDGSAVAREALARALASSRRRIVESDDPQRARRILALLPIDMLISSLSSGEAGGVDLLEHAHRVHPRVRRVACTASQDFGLIRAAINRGAAEFFLEKPWDRVGLADLVACLEAGPDSGFGRVDGAGVDAPVAAAQPRSRLSAGRRGRAEVAVTRAGEMI